MQNGMIAIPRSANPKHIEENFKALDLELSKEDLAQIGELDQNNRQVIPGWAQFDYHR